MTSAFGVATVANWINHKSYWEGTIVRVQTTDFNILSHMLPTKLSYAMQKGNRAEIQSTINSNYGLFGLVVTNCTATTLECPNQQIFYITESTRSWRQQLEIEDLSRHPYDLLRDPPPLVAEWGFEDSHDRIWDFTGEVNPGRVIGRVYYIRGIPQEFWADYSSWLAKLPFSLVSNSGAYRYYTLTVSLFLSSGLAAWGIIEWVFYQKCLAQQEKQRLLKEAQQLRDQLLRQLRQQENLLTKLNDHRAEQTNLERLLTERITTYENSFKQKELKQLHNIQNIENLNCQLQEIQQQRVEGQEQLQKKEQAIASYQAQIAIQEHEKRQIDESLKQLQHQLYISQQELASTSSRIQDFNKSIVSLTQERDSATEQVKQLEKELESVRGAQAANTTALTEALETAKIREQQAGELQIYVIQENEELNKKVLQLKHENEELENKRSQLETQIQQLEKQPETLEAEEIDFSNFLCTLSLALVGGHSNLQRGVIQKLQKSYGLRCTSAVSIPPKSEQRTDQDQLKAKISNHALVVVFTAYCNHNLSDMVSNLEKKKALAGKVLQTDCRGKNHAVRIIAQYVVDHPELLLNQKTA